MNPVNIGILMLKNPCYSKVICISEERVVYPCVMSRLTSYGKLNEKNHLTEILNEKYDRMVEKTRRVRTCAWKKYRRFSETKRYPLITQRRMAAEASILNTAGCPIISGSMRIRRSPAAWRQICVPADDLKITQPMTKF